MEIRVNNIDLDLEFQRQQIFENSKIPCLTICLLNFKGWTSLTGIVILIQSIQSIGTLYVIFIHQCSVE